MLHPRSTATSSILLVLVACGGEMDGASATQGAGGSSTSPDSNFGGAPTATGGGSFGAAPTSAGGNPSGGVAALTNGGSPTIHTLYSGGGTTGQSTLQYHGGSGGFICDFDGQQFVGGRTLVDLAACTSCFCAYSGRFICWYNDCSACSFGGKLYSRGESFAPDACTICTCSNDTTLNCTPLSVFC